MVDLVSDLKDADKDMKAQVEEQITAANKLGTLYSSIVSSRMAIQNVLNPGSYLNLSYNIMSMELVTIDLYLTAYMGDKVRFDKACEANLNLVKSVQQGIEEAKKLFDVQVKLQAQNKQTTH